MLEIRSTINKNRNQSKVIVLISVLITSFFVFIINEKAFADNSPSDETVLNLFEWGENWQNNNIVNYSTLNSKLDTSKPGRRRREVGINIKTEINNAGDTNPFLVMRTLQYSLVSRNGFSNSVWYSEPYKASWGIDNHNEWTNLPKNAEKYTEHSYTGRATYTLPVNVYPTGFSKNYYHRYEWPNLDESVYGVNMLSTVYRPYEELNEYGLAYQFEKGSRTTASLRVDTTLYYDDSKIEPGRDQWNKERRSIISSDNVLYIPQLIKVTYRDIDTLEKISGLPDATYGKDGNWQQSINMTFDKAAIESKAPSGYNYVGYQVATGANIPEAILEEGPNINFPFESQSGVSNIQTNPKHIIKLDNSQYGFVVWLKKERANGVITKKASKETVPLRDYSKLETNTSYPDQEVDYTLKVLNKKVDNGTVQLNDYTLVDELPIGVELKSPIKIERLLSDKVQKGVVPEKKQANGQKPFYEISTNIKGQQLITISGAPAKVGQYDEFYYTAQVKDAKADEVKTNKATLTASNTEATTDTASFKMKEWLVKFEMNDPNNKSPIASQKLKQEERVVEPPVPLYSEHYVLNEGESDIRDRVFDGWYVDEALTQKYDFNLPVKKDLVLYAKWHLLPVPLWQKKALDTETLLNEKDLFGSPGNKKEFAQIGESFSYMIHVKSSQRAPYQLDKLVDYLPDEISLPNQVSLFLTGDGYGVNGVTQVSIPEKKEAFGRDEYYEIIENDPENTLTKRTLKVTLSKERKATENQGFGIMFQTTLEKNNKSHLVDNQARLIGNIRNNQDYYYIGKVGTSFFIPWKVTFKVKEGMEEPDPQFIKDGEKVIKPTGAMFESETFEGWYLDEDFSKSFNFERDVITNDITLFAKWSSPIVDPENGVEPIIPIDPETNEEVPISPVTEGLKIKYVSDFRFGEHSSSLVALSEKSQGEKVKLRDGKIKEVSNYVSIIDNRTSSIQPSGWELRAEAGKFVKKGSNSRVIELKGAEIYLSELNYQSSTSNVPLADSAKEFNLSQGMTLLSESGPKTKRGSWSLAMGHLNSEKKSSGTEIRIPKGSVRYVDDYQSTITWVLTPQLK